MAGGEGTRLRPLTSNQPKPMVPVAGKPCMEHIVELVRRHGLTSVAATLAYMPQVIRGYFADGSNLGVELDYSIEETPAGTAGSVKLLQPYLDDSFLVISGDALTDIDLSALIQFHRNRGAAATLALKRVPDPLEFGVVITAEDGRIERFLEKPSWGEVFSDTINTGIYVLEPEVLLDIPLDRPYDFSKELFPDLLARGAPLYGWIADGYWMDIGNIAQFQQANRDALDGKVELEIAGVRLRDNVWLGAGSLAENIEQIEGPAVIGNYCAIDPNARIGPYTVLGNNVIVKEHCETENCVIDANTYLGPSSQIRGGVIGKNCEVRAHASISEDAVIGDECSIGEQATVGSGVHVYPFKVVETGAQVNRSLVWQPRGASTLFTDEGVAGIVNVDITPETATRLAMAFGTTLSRGEVVVASRDAHPASRMIKRAMIAGIIATGVSVRDLRVATAAVTRFTVMHSRAPGGIHVQISDRDPERLQILFFEGDALPATEATRKDIEKYFNRQETRRALLTQLGDLRFPPRAQEAYMAGLLGAADLERIRAKRFRLALDYAHSSAGLSMGSLLRTMRVEAVVNHAILDPDEQAILGVDVPAFTADTRRIVEAMGGNLGAVFDRSAERVLLIDDRAREIPPDVALHLMVELVCKHSPEGGTVVLPANVSHVAERIAERHGARVVRHGITQAGLITAASEPDVIFAGAPDGGYLFPGAVPGYDAVMTLAKVLELLSLEERPLSQLVDEVPTAALVHQRAPVPWSLKGRAMRELGERVRDQRVEPADGIRVEENGGWAQLVPDPDEPFFHIYAEGHDDEHSAALARRYRELLEEVLRP